MSDPLPPISPAPGSPLDPPSAQPATRPWHRRPVFLTAGALAVAAALAASLFAAGVIGAPSYPHPWCGRVLGVLHNTNQTTLQESAALSQIARQDHAPVAVLAYSLNVYAQAAAAAGEATVGSYAALASHEYLQLLAVAANLKNVNQACGQPADAYQHDAV